jgi:hypothetical protein
MPSSALESELALLRAELQELKRCQVQYFTLSVTGTGAVLGLAGSLDDKAMLGPSLLAPLAIVLPCSWIFFDKATTITRIVGYIRHLEGWIFGADSRLHIGFERALKSYRNLEEAIRAGSANQPPPEASPPPPSWWRLARLGTRHRYWMANWYTFTGLSALCCAFGAYFFSGPRLHLAAWIGSAALLSLFSALYNLVVVQQLTFGRYSYDANEAFWRGALDLAAQQGAAADRQGPRSDQPQ